jgi:amino acid transporter
MSRILSSILFFLIVFWFKYTSQISTELSEARKNAIIHDSLFWATMFLIISYLGYGMIQHVKENRETKNPLFRLSLIQLFIYFSIIIILIMLKYFLLG